MNHEVLSVQFSLVYVFCSSKLFKILNQKCTNKYIYSIPLCIMMERNTQRLYLEDIGAISSLNFYLCSVLELKNKIVLI